MYLEVPVTAHCKCLSNPNLTPNAPVQMQLYNRYFYQRCCHVFSNGAVTTRLTAVPVSHFRFIACSIGVRLFVCGHQPRTVFRTLRLLA